MSTRKLFLMFQNSPIIAAVRNPKDIYDAIHSKSQIIFLLTGNIFNLKKIVELCIRSHKHVFVHVDLVKGYSQDNYFIRFLKDEIKPTGIISTRTSMITRAKQEDLLTIQRLFLLDSLAMDLSMQSVKKIKPDALEVLPGLVPKLITAVKDQVDMPIITGGFIETEEEVLSCFSAGALSASTSHQPLWDTDQKILKNQN